MAKGLGPCRSKDRKMRDEVAGLMLRNLQEVFYERDAAPRVGWVRSIQAKDAEFFEEKGA
jgi:hypothetical protein